MQTPHSDYRSGNGKYSHRNTPQSKSTRAKSRVAVALRNDTEIDGELSNIDEGEEEREAARMQAAHVRRGVPE